MYSLRGNWDPNARVKNASRSGRRKWPTGFARTVCPNSFCVPPAEFKGKREDSLHEQLLPKGPKIERKLISLEIFNPDLQNSPQEIGVCWVACLKISILLENFNPGGRSRVFSNLWALRVSFPLKIDRKCDKSKIALESAKTCKVWQMLAEIG